MTPSPEQVQAAMPAMREWVAMHPDETGGLTEDDAVWAVEETLLEFIARWYPGGVAQFIADQEGRRG